MSKEVAYNEYAAQVMATLPKGAFLTTSYEGKVNSMTIGWGTVGIMWGKPVFMAMVRPSRFTYELLEKCNEFTVSIPLKDMQKALGVCGSQSGRSMDKLAAAGLTAAPGKKISTPVIAGAGLHYECKVIYKQTMEPNALQADYLAACYPKEDYHVLYMGEIVATYKDE